MKSLQDLCSLFVPSHWTVIWCIGVVTGGAAGALAPPLSDMGGQEYVCAPPLNVEQNHSYVEIILNHYNSSHFMANLFYFQQQLSKHFSWSNSNV